MAERSATTSRGGLRAVERFMKHYFLVAKDVGDLTTILCSALEMQQLKTSPGSSRLLSPLNWKTRRQLRTAHRFPHRQRSLNVADPDVFKRDPVNLIRFFAEASQTDAFLHPDAIRLLAPVAAPHRRQAARTTRKPTASFVELLSRPKPVPRCRCGA